MAFASARPIASVFVASAFPVSSTYAASPRACASRACASLSLMSMPTADAASCACMSAVPFAFSTSTRAISARSSSAYVAFSWFAISRLVSTEHELVRELDVLDVHAAGLDVVRVEVRGDRLVARSPAPRARVSMKRTASRLWSVLRKWLPTAACSTSFTRFCIVPTIEMTFGARVSGTWICTCRSMRNTKPSRLFASIGERCASRLCAVDTAFGPVERQDRRRHDLGRVHTRVDRVLAGAQRLAARCRGDRDARSNRT